jgi:hypothetical protein
MSIVSTFEHPGLFNLTRFLVFSTRDRGVASFLILTQRQSGKYELMTAQFAYRRQVIQLRGCLIARMAWSFGVLGEMIAGSR